MLIVALVGIDKWATMDMDVTIKNYPLDVEPLIKVFDEICSINVYDNMKFNS